MDYVTDALRVVVMLLVLPGLAIYAPWNRELGLFGALVLVPFVLFVSFPLMEWNGIEGPEMMGLSLMYLAYALLFACSFSIKSLTMIYRFVRKRFSS